MSQSSSQHTTALVRGADLTADERYRLLSNDLRRATIAVLDDRSGRVELSEVASAVAARVDDVDATAVDAEVRVETALHHAHLPKLDDYGVVEYDPEANVVVA